MIQQILLRAADAILTAHKHRRIRLMQFLITVPVYLLSGLSMWLGVRASLLSGPLLAGWAVAVACGLALFYFLIRSGRSESFVDPALTGAQMLFGILVVMWGYLMCGPVRSATLFPLMLIFTFGAFSLGWRRIAVLTAFALACLLASIAILRHGIADEQELVIDISNFLGVVVLLPACSMLAARLSALRMKLRSQRAELTEALQEVQRLATRDELTGLVNRRRMSEIMQIEQQICMRSGRPFCIAVIDLDHFKQVNDSNGHPAGDAMLRAFAGSALARMRSSNVLARWGGDEFLLLMPDTNAPLARIGVERLREHIAALNVDIDGKFLQLTISAGVTEYRAGEPIEETIARADQALYTAKSLGRNRLELS